MAQFFILKKYRRRGLGSQAAASVFAALPGRWEVGQMTNNHAAQAFWRRVIAANAPAGVFAEHRLSGGWWEGLVQCFESPASSAGTADSNANEPISDANKP